MIERAYWWALLNFLHLSDHSLFISHLEPTTYMCSLVYSQNEMLWGNQRYQKCIHIFSAACFLNNFVSRLLAKNDHCPPIMPQFSGGQACQTYEC